MSPRWGSTPNLTDWLTDWPSVAMWLWLCEFGGWKPVSSAREMQWDRRQSERTGSREHGGWGIYGIGSHYQTTTGDDTADWEGLVRAAVNCRICELALALELLIATISKCSIDPSTNPKPVYSHSHTWQYSSPSEHHISFFSSRFISTTSGNEGQNRRARTCKHYTPFSS
jgi:hypothetical protein